jgi:hypothetical protein
MQLFGKERYDDYHVSGFGTSIKAGLNVTFFKHFIPRRIKGVISICKIFERTQSTDDDCTQDFSFFKGLLPLEVYSYN